MDTSALPAGGAQPVKTDRRISGALLRMALAAVAFGLLPMGIANARSLFWSGYRPMWNDYAPFRFEHKHAHKRPAATKKVTSNVTPKGPLQIIISIANQRISIYENGTRIAQSSVSTGVPDHPTPLGIFSVIAKQRWH